MSDVPFSSQNLEQAIMQIKSIIAARINVNNQGEIEEVHVLAGSGRAPKQVVRDVESVMAAQFGLQVDHKKISVAQVGNDEESAFEVLDSTRPKLVGVTLRTVNGMAEVKVELLTDDKLAEGIAEGPSSANNKLRLFVEATLKALALIVRKEILFVVEDVAIIPMGKQQGALVSITLITPAGEQSLAGCALVRSDDREAVVKATLDAINRKLKFFKND